MNVVTDEQLTRRRLLELGIAMPLPLVLAAAAGRAENAAAALDATPACDDGDETPEQTEGPYWTPRSPRRRSLLAASMPGTRLVVAGTVLSTACKAVPGAVLDFWQADAKGVYDNRGYRLRGHQFSDPSGRYRLETVVPGLYPGRTRHVHVKVKAPRQPVLTTQLYFPAEPDNQRDGLFDPALLVRVTKRAPSVWTARFDFVVDLG